MEEISSSSASSSTILLSSSPAIDRYNPIIRDSTRNAKPFSSFNTYDQPPISSKTHKIQYKKKNKKIPLKDNGDQAKIKNFDYTDKLKDEKKISSTEVTNYGNTNGWSCIKNADLITPPSSTRYLLSSHDKVYFNSGLSDFDPVLKLFPGETSKSKAVKTDQVYDETPPQTPPQPPPPPPPPPSSYVPAEQQVVVLRVSLHCRGCERKMRKHISKMEGVTSFHIDFAAKKVTVIGNVTPLSVLSSISKVKNAQLWPPTISSSSIPTAVNLSNSEFNNGYKGAGA